MSSVTLKNPEDGEDMFSETSVLTTATPYTVSEDIYRFYRREKILEGSFLRPYTYIYYSRGNLAEQRFLCVLICGIFKIEKLPK
jgi:hypothetical protein